MNKKAISPLAAEIDSYISKGYSVVPIAPDSKNPSIYEPFSEKWLLMPSWQRFSDVLPSEFMVSMWKEWPDAGLGFVCGGINKIVALDFNIDKDGLHKQIQDIAGYSPCKKRGLHGYTAFYRAGDGESEASRNWAIDGQSIVELLSKGRQTIMPPSIHVTAKIPYAWIGEGHKPIYDFDLDYIPYLPKDFVKEVDKIFQKPELSGLPQDYFYDDPSQQEIIDALKCIPSDITYPEWIKMGMAIQRQLGQAGYRIWQDWSSSGAKYRGPKDCEYHWRAIKADHGVTIRTLFKLSKEHGYKTVTNNIDKRLHTGEVIDADGVILTPEIYNHNIMLGIAGKSTADENFTSYDAVLSCPSPIIKSMQDWLLSIAIRPQPVYALAATIAAIGVLFGHKIKSPTNLRTNMFCITLGASSSGKDVSLKGIDQIFNIAGLSNLIGGTPKSGPSIISNLAESQGKKLYQLDEFGIYLSPITSNRSQGYQNEILSNWMRLFSSAGGIFKGDEYANKDGKSPRKDLNNPHLCVNGVSTPVRFWEALSSKHAIDGLLARFLVFESDNPTPDRQMPADIYDVPSSILDAVAHINSMPSNISNDPKEVLRGIIRPYPVKFTEKADAHLNEFAAYCDKKKAIEYARKGMAEPIWGRGHEHAVKLALCAYNFQDINLEIAEWATMVTKICINRCILSLEDNISDSQHETTTKKVYVIIRLAGADGLKKSDLAYKTRWLTSRERDNALSDLLEQNRIEIFNKPAPNGKGAPAKMIRVLDL